jgi:hypothetical protein
MGRGGDPLCWWGAVALWGWLPDGLGRQFGLLPWMPFCPPRIAFTPPLIRPADRSIMAWAVGFRHSRRSRERVALLRRELPLARTSILTRNGLVTRNSCD